MTKQINSMDAAINDAASVNRIIASTNHIIAIDKLIKRAHLRNTRDNSRAASVKHLRSTFRLSAIVIDCCVRARSHSHAYSSHIYDILATLGKRIAHTNNGFVATAHICLMCALLMRTHPIHNFMIWLFDSVLNEKSNETVVSLARANTRILVWSFGFFLLLFRLVCVYCFVALNGRCGVRYRYLVFE